MIVIVQYFTLILRENGAVLQEEKGSQQVIPKLSLWKFYNNVLVKNKSHFMAVIP